MILLNTNLVRKTDLSEIESLLFSEHKHFTQITEHYLLLGYLSKSYPDGSKFLDIGTRRGNSAVAMALNPNIEVHSFDIVDEVRDRVKKDNITFFVRNILEDVTEILQYDVVLIDIDPHHGSEEKRLINYLRDNEWKGILLVDDIKDPPWKAMCKMWNELEDVNKYDITAMGHASGTGLIDYGNNVEVQL